MRYLFLLLFCSPLISPLMPAQGPAHSSSIFWEIRGPKLDKPSYLLGSIHIADERVFAFDSAVWKAFHDADALVLEVKMDEIDPMVMMKSMIDETIDYEALLGDDYALFEEAMEMMPQFPKEMLTKLRPFFLLSLIQQSVIPSDRAEPLDLFFLKEARRMKKTVMEVESFEDQMQAVMKVPAAEWLMDVRSMLRDSLMEEKLEAEYQKLLTNYLQEDADAFWQLMLEEKEQKPNFTEYFILKRNDEMVKKIISYMGEKNLFVLVGAGHLAGPQGIVEQLKKAGYQLRPLSAGLKNK